MSPAGLQTHSVAAALQALDTRIDGLAGAEAARRLELFGPNRLPRSRPASALRILAAQFRSVVVLLLLAATALSLVLGDYAQTVAVAVVIALNAGLGFTIELRARRAMEALLDLAPRRATVRRDGRLQVLDADLLVPGDIVEVSAGQLVPADGRVITETDLRTNEAALTGESLPVSKQADVVLVAETPLAERLNMVYQGTTVTAGRAVIAVADTGASTELGRIGALTQSLPEEKTPLERRLDALGRRLVWVTLAVAALVALLGAAQGAPWRLMIETAIALAVAAVPEGLPAVSTIALAIGLHRMARRHALVRRLPAVEALGSTTVICTDKTRTLTSGEMAVVRVWSAGRDYELDPLHAPAGAEQPLRRALEVAALASRQQAQTDAHSGPRPIDPVDEAVLHAARQIRIVPANADGILAASIPFSSDRKFMAEVHRVDAQLTAFVKGAPHVLLERSARLWRPGGAVPIAEAERTRLMDVNTRMAAEGLRVLAVASGPVTGTSDADLRGLTFIGFLGLMDPPADGVKEAIAALRGAGLRTVMLTGDQKLTAEAIGEQLGLGASATFSRVTPRDKLEIVTSLQRQGEIVAMLGDGVNDAPALRKADVGVAMGGRGTDAAKQAASIVLQDDRFATIVAAVEEGRVIFDNIRKFVFYLFSCNLAEVLVLLVAGVAGLPLPLRPMQILWLNLVTDTFPALALAVEPGNADVMKRPPRDPQAAILSSSFLASVVTYAGLITISTLAAFAWALAHNSASATTMAFLTLGFAQIFHLGNARSDRPVLHPEAATANRYAIAAVVFAAGMQLLAVYATPVAAVLNVTLLTPREAYVVVVCSAITPVVGQALRLRRAPGDDPRPTP